MKRHNLALNQQQSSTHSQWQWWSNKVDRKMEEEEKNKKSGAGDDIACGEIGSRAHALAVDASEVKVVV